MVNFKNAKKASNEFQLNFDKQTAQFTLRESGKEPVDYVPPFYETPDRIKSQKIGFNDFAIAHLDQISKPFKLRLLIKHDAKFGTHFDAEISQQRTATVSRENYFPETLKIIPENLDSKIELKLFKLN